MTESAIVFDCDGDQLVGVVHGTTAGRPAVGILIVVGGPQYRAGSHRQFVLLARALAAAGIPAMRFDYRGMGDSAGQFRGFEDVGADIAAAIDAFARAVPGIERVVLWGLCDGASAIMFYAHRDPRVAGLAVLNPWVRTEAGLAKAQLKHYYLRRLLDGQSWRRLLTGRLSVGRSLAGVAGTVRSAMDDSGVSADSALPDRMAAGLSQFRGPVLLVLSGNDLTAREFEDAVSGSAVWRRLLGLEWVRRHDLPGADHTLSRREWRDQVTDWTIAWAKSL